MNKILLNSIIKEGFTNNISQSEFLKLVKNIPIDGIEIRREFLPVNTEEKREEISSIMETCKEKKWMLFYSIPESLFSEEGLNENFENFLLEAKKMNVQSIKMNIGNLVGISKVDANKFNHTLNKYQVCLSIENDQTEINGTFKTVQEALKLIKECGLEIGYTFDSGNWVVKNEDPSRCFQSLKDYITVFHLKDIGNGTTQILGEGEIQWKALLPKNYEIPIILEYPMLLEQIKLEIEKVRKAI